MAKIKTSLQNSDKTPEQRERERQAKKAADAKKAQGEPIPGSG